MGLLRVRIPGRNTEQFIREVTDQCLISQGERISRGTMFKNYALLGAANKDEAAIYNKIYPYLDDVASLLFSPVSLRYHISDPDLPNVVELAKGRAASAALRTTARRSDTDTMIGETTWWSLVKGKCFIKQDFGREGFAPNLIQPESMGVLRENHGALDENMDAFTHSMWITPYQYERLIAEHPDRELLRKRARRYVRERPSRPNADNPRSINAGAWQPFRSSTSPPAQGKNIVNWMGSGDPTIAPQIAENLLRLDETWVWDDDRDDWTTFQIVGDDMLLMGKYVAFNALAWNPLSHQEIPYLKGKHPFIDFCPTPMHDYFWGMSEIPLIAMLQEAINARLIGIGKLLRRQEDPSYKATGISGVNQNVFSKFKRGGNVWSDANPGAKMESDAPVIPEALFLTLHEYERMIDEMGGLPPIAKGRGEPGVRSAGHADTLIRMFSPRFKDRALLIERSVEAEGALRLDMSRAHIAKKMIAWVQAAEGGVEVSKEESLLVPPAEGLAPVFFTYADLDEDVSLTVDAHSSSPAFAADAKSMIYDLLKIGAAGPDDVIEASDVADPEAMIAGYERRTIARAKAAQEAEKMKLIKGGKTG